MEKIPVLNYWILLASCQVIHSKHGVRFSSSKKAIIVKCAPNDVSKICLGNESATQCLLNPKSIISSAVIKRACIELSHGGTN